MCYAGSGMVCPQLDQLPAPPAGRTGWPWTEGSPAFKRQTGEAPLPSITVVIPSFQQADFLEETLRSVLLQGYPALEVLVMDGGSTDGSVEIIRRYEKWITRWVSEPDGGQTAAINKGWRQATGELLTWLNSDDLLLPGWAEQTVRLLQGDPTVDLAYCDVQVIDAASRPTWVYRGETPTVERLILTWRTTFAQQGFLMRRRVLEVCGYLDERLDFTMDTEYWLRLLVAGRKLAYVPGTLGSFRMHEAAKSTNIPDVHLANMIDVTKRFCEEAPAEMSSIAERARRRLHWNVAHAKYARKKHTEARASALRYIRDNGWRALPQAGAMVGLSFLGDRGHSLLALFRRLKMSV